MKIYISKGRFVFLIIIPIMLLLSCTIVFSSLVQVAATQVVNPNASIKTGSPCTGSFTFVPGFLQYLNPGTGVQLEYPPDWKKVEYIDGVKFASPFENASDFYQEYVYIYSVNDTNLNELVSNQFKYIRQNYEVNIVKANPVIVNTTLLGSPARQVIFEYNDGKRDIMQKYVIISREDKAYVILYFAEPSRFYEYLPIVQKMIDSFKIEFCQYENPSLGISIQYPLDWELQEDNKKSIVKFLGPEYNISNTYLSVLVDNSTMSSNLDDILSSEESLQDYKLLKSSNTTSLGGGLAHKILYNFTSGRAEVKGMMIFTIHNGKLYEIKFFANADKFDNYLPIAQKMIDSFKIVDFLPFENSKITIEYPSHWKRVIDGTNVTFLSPIEGYSDSFQEYISISSSDVPYNMTLAKLINGIDHSYSQNQIINISNAKSVGVNTTLSGNTTKGYQIDYKFTDYRQRDFILKQVDAINEGRLYEIKFFANADKFDNYLPIVQKMIDSFKIVDFLRNRKIDFKTYENPVVGIEMNYPSDWLKVEEDKTSVYFKSPLETHCSYCWQRLSIKVVPSEGRLEQIISSQINSLRQAIPNMKLIELNATMIGGNQAYKVIYKYYYPIPTKVMELITINEDKTYVISFESDTERYYDYLPTIEKILNSLVIDSTQSIDPNFQEINDAGVGIKVASNPFAISFDPITDILYVSNTRSNTVSVIDTTRNNIISNITVDNFPYAIAVDESQNTVYVANEKSNTISVIDGSTNRLVDTIRVDIGPVDVAVNSYADRLYTANFCSNSISVIEASTNTVLKNITLGKRPDSCSAFGMGIAVNTFTNMIYVTNKDSDTIYVIDGNTDNIVDRIHVIGPVSVAVNPITNTIYSVRSNPNGIVDVIDGYSNNVVANFSVSLNPNIIIVNPSTNMVYVTNTGSGNLSVINGSENKPVLNITVGTGPAGVTVDQDTNTLYVANQFSNTVSIINGSSNKLIVGVNFNVDPLGSGEIICNDHKIQNNDYKKYDINTYLKCEAKANNIFPPTKFASWSIIPPMMFESWSSDLTSDTRNEPIATFKAFQHGQLIANFKEIIAKDYMNTIFGTVLGLAIPALGGILYKKREWLFSKFDRHSN